MSWDPTTAFALADVAHRGIVRCGIHGAIIIDRRCSDCDAERATKTDQTNNQRSI